MKTADLFPDLLIRGVNASGEVDCNHAVDVRRELALSLVEEQDAPAATTEAAEEIAVLEHNVLTGSFAGILGAIARWPWSSGVARTNSKSASPA
jgi:hypothetical protein